MSGFAQALPHVLRVEGGFVDDPDDRGGRTNFGITQNTFDVWNGSKGLRKRDVKDVTPDEVAAIYHERYWVAGKCDALPWPLSAAHFDACVNHGKPNAAKMLQEALGVTIDGKIGPKTLAAVEAADTDDLVDDLLWVRLEFYRSIARGSQEKFLRGWVWRLLKVAELVR